MSAGASSAVIFAPMPISTPSRQSPERSGLPSEALGAGAVRFGLPSGVRGMPGVGWSSHWAVTSPAGKSTAAQIRIGIRLMMTSKSAVQQTIEQGFGLIEAFHHPDIERPLGDGDEGALAVGMNAEAGDAVGGGGQVHGRQEFIGAGLDVHRIELPLCALTGGVAEDAVQCAAVTGEAVGLQLAVRELARGLAVRRDEMESVGQRSDDPL